MFPREKRIARSEMPAALMRARRVSTTHFTLVFPVSLGGYAVIVPKAVARLSVTRHKTKRRILEALKRLPLPRGLVVYAKKGAPMLTFSETLQELTKPVTEAR